jgi:uncharacterized membrane protein
MIILMSTLLFVFLAFGIGIVAGLRALTAPMVVSWAARFGWINVHHSWAGFLAGSVTPWILTILALGELANDLNPKAPARTVPGSFAFRVLSAEFCAGVLATGSGHSALLGVLLGTAGAIVGTLGGYRARTRLVKALKVRDLSIALPEDLVAVGGGFLIVSLFR